MPTPDETVTGTRGAAAVATPEADPSGRQAEATDSLRPHSLAWGLVALGGGEMLAKLFNFAAFTFMGRVLGPGRYGSVEFVLATITFYTLPVDLGLGIYGAREIARGRTAPSALLSTVVCLRMLLATVSYASLAATLLVIPEPAEVEMLLAIYGLGLFAAPLQLQWLFQGHGRMHWVSAVSVVRYGTFAGLVLAFLGPGVHLALVGVFECAALLAASAVCVALAWGGLDVRPRGGLPRPGELVRHIRRAAPIGFSELSWAVQWCSATVLLGLWAPGEPLGWYGAAHRIVLALHTFVWLYFYNLLPTMSRYADRPGPQLRRLLGGSLTLTCWAAALGALLVTLLAEDLFVVAYGEAFRGAGPVLTVLIWALPLALLSGHYRYALIACDHQTLEFACTAASALVAAVLGLALIPSLGALGAATALVSANAVNLALACGLAKGRIATAPPIVGALKVASALAAALIYRVSFPGGDGWTSSAGPALIYVLAGFLWEGRAVIRFVRGVALPGSIRRRGEG